MAENESKAEGAKEPKSQVQETKPESNPEAEVAKESNAKTQPGPRPDENLGQKLAKDSEKPTTFDRAVEFMELKGKPIAWIATVAIPFVVAFYAYKADRLAEKQHEQAVKQTEIQDKQRDIFERQTTIQDKQRDILERQTAIQEAQNQLTKLQYEPTFVLRINGDVDSRNRVVDVYNVGANVRELDAFLYSAVRVDWVLPKENNRRHVTFFGFARGNRTYDKLQPQVVAQFRTDIDRAVITRLQRATERSEDRRVRDQWIPVRIQQTDWVHLTYKTRANDDLRTDDQQIGDRLISRNPVLSMGEAARENFYFNGVVAMQDREFRFSDFLGGYFKVGDEQANERFLLDYMKHAHLACPGIRALNGVDQARNQVINAIEREIPLDETFFSSLQSPVRCKQADVEVTIEGVNYTWKFAQQ